MRFLSRHRVPSVTDAFPRLGYRRRMIDVEEFRWPRGLQRLREDLPNGLADKRLLSNAESGTWAIEAVVDSVPVGLAWFVRVEGLKDTASVEEVVVERNWRHHGVGSRLVKECSRWMVELGFDQIAIYPVGPQDWIERIGFTHMGYGTYFASAGEIAGESPEAE